MPAITEQDHRRNAALVRRVMATYARSEDLVRIGAYKAGSDVELDRALASRPAMKAFLIQDSQERAGYRDSVITLRDLAREME
jgi:flagellum-specific ATP synthase